MKNKIKKIIGITLLTISYGSIFISIILLGDYKIENLNLFLICMFVVFPISFIGGCKILKLK